MRWYIHSGCRPCLQPRLILQSLSAVCRPGPLCPNPPVSGSQRSSFLVPLCVLALQHLWPAGRCRDDHEPVWGFKPWEVGSFQQLWGGRSGEDTSGGRRSALPTESPTATHPLKEPAKPSLACRIWSKWNGCWFQPLSFEVFVVQWVITETVIFCSSVCGFFLIDIFSCEFENLASVTVTVYNFLSQVNRDNY